MNMQNELRLVIIFGFAAAGLVCPAAARKSQELRARDLFERAITSHNDGLKDLGLSLAQVALKKAGHDTDTDAPYIQVLSLARGRQQFENLRPKR